MILIYYKMKFKKKINGLHELILKNNKSIKKNKN